MSDLATVKVATGFVTVGLQAGVVVQGPVLWPVLVTELDVDDTEVPAPDVDRTVASKYGEFLDLMMPYVKVVTFEQLRDDPALPKRPDGLPHRPNLFDASYQPTPAYRAVLGSLQGA